jgi:alanine dehydrogenase
LKTLILTDEEVRSLLSIGEVIEAVEEAFKEKGLGHVQMPSKPYLFFERYGGDLRVMPSYLERMEIAAVKVVNSHPRNPSSYDLPTVMATMILVDPRTGAPIAIIGGAYLTALRTGAAGGIAAKHLARTDSKVVGLVGAGVQARTQLMALLSVYGQIEKVRICDKAREAREKFIEEMEPQCGRLSELVAVESVEKAVKGADIMVTTTPSTHPIVMDEWISEGMHLNCIGADAPTKEELDPSILKRAKIVVDDWEQASHCGEIGVPLAKGMIKKEDIWGSIGEIVAGLKEGRSSPQEITVFTSTGLAIQDAVTAQLAYEKAVAENIGRTVELT